MTEQIARVCYVVHRPGDTKPITQSWVSESAARAQACTIVRVQDERKGRRHDGYLTWADLRRRRYYSAQATMVWYR